MEDLDIRLKEKELSWIRVYFASGFNASEATRCVYGGTPLSCRVKGHKRMIKLVPVICDIIDRGFDKMANGVDFYLEDLQRKAKEREDLMEKLKLTRGLKRLRGLTQPLLSSPREGENG